MSVAPRRFELAEYMIPNAGTDVHESLVRLGWQLNRKVAWSPIPETTYS